MASKSLLKLAEKPVSQLQIKAHRRHLRIANMIPGARKTKTSKEILEGKNLTQRQYLFGR